MAFLSLRDIVINCSSSSTLRAASRAVCGPGPRSHLRPVDTALALPSARALRLALALALALALLGEVPVPAAAADARALATRDELGA